MARTRATAPPAPAMAGQRSAGRALDAPVRRAMEQRLGHDFGRVRVHSDARAAAAAAGVGARAFTLGSDVVFGAGEYSPHTPAGRRLLQHELAHVVQQSGRPLADGPPRVGRASSDAERAADEVSRSPAPRPAARRRLSQTAPPSPLLQRAATTWAGEFDTDKYDAVQDGGKDVGVDITLRFKPGRNVFARKIGMVQTSIAKVGGKAAFASASDRGRAIPAGKAGEGVGIDRVDDYANPLYATKKASPGDTLSSTPTTKGWGRHGWRYTDGGKLHKQDALLIDKPTITPPGVNRSEVFESTALAVDGAQRGTYYGSVRWGWEIDAAGAFTKLPLSVVSADAPSDVFGAAAELWNASKTAAGDETIDLPLVTGKYTNAKDVELVGNPAKAKDSVKAKLPVNTRVEVTDKAAGRLFNLGADQWWMVTVVDGPRRGAVGWISAASLADAKAP
ncbi:DUF4157 domain-containing protein [Longimicrobium sp.]|uniref:eCIS core domain-containing protein n=1 Tax=Longimicrobium sp. TaxID=2029185 RepID=UPI002D810AD5|nr:DUF4157 domain-containing protein [Longimicrobium sp.]